MATNPLFRPYSTTEEQDLLEGLVVESIQIYGYDVYYLPRTLLEVDPVYGEEEVSQFNSALPIEVYVKNVQGFSGDGQFLSMQGIEIRDRLTFCMARRRWTEDLEDEVGNPRPREGDVIYFPLTGGYYEIKFVEQEANFYQLGRLNVYELVCELFEYSHEQFNTGIEEIDRLEGDYSTVAEIDDLTNEDGDFITVTGDFHLKVADTPINTQDPGSNNDDFDDEVGDLIDFSITNPFSE